LARKIAYIYILLLFCITLPAQGYRLEILTQGESGIKGLIPATHNVEDSIETYLILKNTLGKAQEMGYLAISADSIILDSLAARAFIWTGPRFLWGDLSFDSISPSVLRDAGINPKKYTSKFINTAKLARVREKLLTYYENRGYPFASTYMEGVNISGDRVSGQIRVRPYDLFLVDSLHIKGEVKVHPSYMRKLTGISPGDPYNEENIRKISSRIRESLFLKEIRPFELEFFKGGVDVYTYLEKTRSSQFNGIIGVLPGHSKTGKVQVTGEVDLLLLNSFGRGESLYFGWNSLEPQSQELDVQMAYPYIFNSNIGVGFTFDLIKQDTSYLNLNPVLDLRFYLGGSSYLTAFIDHFSSSIISKSGLENAVVLPPQADVTSNLYGFGVYYSSLDYSLNPSAGWDIDASLGIGSKIIRKNSAISELAYEGVDLNTTKIQSTAIISFYQPLAGSFVLHLSTRAGLLRNDHLFENELFRLGGINSLRGLEENSVYASSYWTGTIETKFLFDQGSAMFLFFDGGYYERADDFTSDYPIGFGAGLQLRTAAGIFMLNYALGRQFNNPINIGEAKIHIGYLNRF
jgi:outer membrane protein assembly factor BamA